MREILGKEEESWASTIKLWLFIIPGACIIKLVTAVIYGFP
jgi:hypothetical protein